MTYPDRLRGGLLGLMFGVLPVVAIESGGLVAAASPDFNTGWRFHLGDVAGASAPEFDDARWRVLDLPHDWSIELPRTKDAPDGDSAGQVRGGIGWYRKHFVLTAEQAGRVVDLIFDGVQQECEVWINGHYLGLQPHGYVPFVHTLTRHLRPAGQPNVLAVRAVNPEFNTRWYSGSGIYRPVQLRLREPVDVATWGLRLSTVWIHQGRAQVQLRAEIRNETADTQSIDLVVRLTDPSGQTRELPVGGVRVAPAAAETVGQLFTVEAARLWSPDSPELYVADLRLRQGGRDIGGLAQTFGIRQVSVSAKDGLRLNGAPVKLHGACLHHDNGLIGAAVFPAAEWRRVEIMKRNGFNAIRTSHNPPSAAFLDACDRLGVLVIDEFADTWELPKKPNSYTRYFASHWEKDLRAMLRRDFNHPSVIIWSIGNEIQERALPSGLETAGRLVAAIRAVDPERPITNAICEFWDNPAWHGQWDLTAPAFALLDIGGYNYQWAEYEKDHAKHPERVMMGTESYPIQAYETWRPVERFPYVIGDFVWTGMDHLGESGIGHVHYLPPGEKDPAFLWPWPTYINWSGDIDIIGNKKPQSYYRDVVWKRSAVELAVHAPIPAGKAEIVSGWGWPDELPSWTWRGAEGQTLKVRVFSRAPRVRLELNGKSLGERTIDPAQGIAATFEVPYAPGELKATAIDASGAAVGSRVLVTTGAAAAVALTPELDRVKAARDQVIYVPVEIRDSAGRRVEDAAVKLTAEIGGAAELLGFGSGNPAYPGPLNTPETASFRGQALLILRAKGEPGNVTIRVSADGLAPGVAQFELAR